MNIRPLADADVDAVHRLAVLCFRTSAWPRDAFAGLTLPPPHLPGFTGPRRWVLVADLPDRSCVAFLAMQAVLDDAEIQALAVEPDLRQRGLGSALLCAGMERAWSEGAEKIYLEVRASNIAAQRLYARYGFVEYGRRPLYYHHPDETAVLMRSSH